MLKKRSRNRLSGYGKEKVSRIADGHCRLYTKQWMVGPLQTAEIKTAVCKNVFCYFVFKKYIIILKRPLVARI
jgi:hypothetical protein